MRLLEFVQATRAANGVGRFLGRMEVIDSMRQIRQVCGDVQASDRPDYLAGIRCIEGIASIWTRHAELAGTGGPSQTAPHVEDALAIVQQIAGALDAQPQQGLLIGQGSNLAQWIRQAAKAIRQSLCTQCGTTFAPPAIAPERSVCPVCEAAACEMEGVDDAIG